MSVRLWLGGVLAAFAMLAGLGAHATDSPDALTVTMCGTSGPLPIRDRAKACVAIQAGGLLYLVDVGPESNKNLMLWRLPLGKVGAVFITHLHSDHIGDLGEFNMQSWVAGRPAPLTVVGPAGTDRLVAGFNEAYTADHGFRHAHHDHGDVRLPIDDGVMVAKVVALPTAPDAEGVVRKVVWTQNGLTVTAISVNHFPVVPAFGYRFDYKGRSVVISGDTRKWPPLATAAKGADVLIHEAQNSDMTKALVSFLGGAGMPRQASIMTDTLSYHTTPVEAAQIARDAGVKALVLTHLTQAGLPFFTPQAFTKGMNETGFTNWRLADDGLVITLPVGSAEIAYSHR